MAIILSLETIVKTNFIESIRAFQQIADHIQPGISIPKLIPALKPLFLEFNLKHVSETQFQEKLLKASLAKEPATAQFLAILFGKTQPPWLSSSLFKKEFIEVLANKQLFIAKMRQAWNMLISIDAQATSLIQLIIQYKKLGVNIVIYSDTNEIHFAHLKHSLTALGLNTEEIQTTFQHQQPKEQLIQTVIESSINKNPTENCVLVLSSAYKINNNSFDTPATKPNNVDPSTRNKAIMVIPLTTLRLTPVKLNSIVQEYFGETNAPNIDNLFKRKTFSLS